MKDNRPYLGVFQTHPIQYQVPLWRLMAQSDSLRIKVFYATRHGLETRMDPLWGLSFAWDIPLIEGYPHEFLSPAIRIPFLPGPVANYYPCGLSKALASEPFDAVLLNGYMTGVAWAGYRAARRLRLPILLRGDSHLHRSKSHHCREWGKNLFLRHFLSRVSWCLAIGAWNRDYWRHYGMPDSRIRTTLYAVDNDHFSHARQGQPDRIRDLRLAWKVDPNETVFGYVGNFQPHKGINILLKAFMRLCEKRDNIHLVLIGAGPAENALRQEVKDENQRIHWLGFVNQAELPVYLSSIDMLVLPSLCEAWGLVVNEAMAAGTPCIVTDACGSGPDLIEVMQTGLVVRANDIEALEVAMNQACDPEQRTIWRGRIPAILERASFVDNLRVIVECVTKCSEEHKSQCGF